MVSKRVLLKNVKSYTLEELAEAVYTEVVTLCELENETDGEFTPSMKEGVKAILAQPKYSDSPSTEGLSSKQPKLKKDRAVIEKPFSFKGRIGILEYWASSFICAILGILIRHFAVSMDPYYFGVGKILLIIAIIPCVWFALAQITKRCHDLGLSGFFILLPVFNLWLVFWLLFKVGDESANKYGEPSNYGR